jgi:hypothetical protein
LGTKVEHYDGVMGELLHAAFLFVGNLLRV